MQKLNYALATLAALGVLNTAGAKPMPSPSKQFITASPQCTAPQRGQRPMFCKGVDIVHAALPVSNFVAAHNSSDLGLVAFLTDTHENSRFMRAETAVAKTGQGQAFSAQSVLPNDPTSVFEYGVAMRPNGSALFVARYKVTADLDQSFLNGELQKSGLPAIKDKSSGYHTLHAVEIAPDGKLTVLADPDKVSLAEFGLDDRTKRSRDLPREPVAISNTVAGPSVARPTPAAKTQKPEYF